mgnify:CR=1 FL=1
MRRSVFLALVLTVCCFGGVCISAHAEGSPTFGYVSVSQAMVLHPLMAKMDPKEGRFDLSAMGGKFPVNHDESRKKLAEKRVALTKKKASCEKILGDLEAAFQKGMGELSPLQHRINSLPPSARPPGLDEYNKKKTLIEKGFWLKRDETKLDLDKVATEMADTLKENQLLHLTSVEETDQIFHIILDDVYQAIDAVSTQSKVAFVFNSSFSIERTAANPSFVPVNPLGEFLGKPQEGNPEDLLFKHGKDGRAPLFANLSYWTASQRWTLRNCTDARTDKLFIKGGISMTPAVVDQLYERYKVSAIQRQVVRRYLEELAKGKEASGK